MKEDILGVCRDVLVANMNSSIAFLVLAIAAVVAFEETFDQSLTNEPHHTIVTRAARPCSTAGCTDPCRKLGHARGVCIGSLCQCRSRKRRSIVQTETQNIEPVITIPVPEYIPAIEAQIPEQKHSIVTRSTGCGAASCTSFCQKLGHKRGVCIGTYCQCRFQ